MRVVLFLVLGDSIVCDGVDATFISCHLGTLGPPFSKLMNTITKIKVASFSLLTTRGFRLRTKVDTSIQDVKISMYRFQGRRDFEIRYPNLPTIQCPRVSVSVAQRARSRILYLANDDRRIERTTLIQQEKN